METPHQQPHRTTDYYGYIQHLQFESQRLCPTQDCKNHARQKIVKTHDQATQTKVAIGVPKLRGSPKQRLRVPPIPRRTPGQPRLNGQVFQHYRERSATIVYRKLMQHHNLMFNQNRDTNTISTKHVLNIPLCSPTAKHE